MAQKQKVKEKLKTKTDLIRRNGAIIVREGSPGGRSETTGGRICETGMF